MISSRSNRLIAVLGGLASLTITSCVGGQSSSSASSSGDPLSSGEESSESASSSAEPISIQLLRDRSFSTGFYLREWTTVNGGPVVRRLDYGGTAQGSTQIWTMARWWDPFDFKNAVETQSGDSYRYEDESSYCVIKPGQGEMTMHLNSYTEYQEKFGGSRSDATQNWSHFLIEQNGFAQSVTLAGLKSLTAKLTFSIDQCDLLDEENYNPNMHTAQLFWYLTLTNITDEGATDQGTYGDYIWFGIPLFDYRYKKIEEYKNIDAGVEGSTNKLIYSMCNDQYLPVSDDQGIEIGKEYTIEIDILPYMKDAFVYAVTHDCLVGADASRIHINYMNFGWELPGSFEITSIIKGMSLTAVI